MVTWRHLLQSERNKRHPCRRIYCSVTVRQRQSHSSVSHCYLTLWSLNCAGNPSLAVVVNPAGSGVARSVTGFSRGLPRYRPRPSLSSYRYLDGVRPGPVGSERRGASSRSSGSGSDSIYPGYLWLERQGDPLGGPLEREGGKQNRLWYDLQAQYPAAKGISGSFEKV